MNDKSFDMLVTTIINTFRTYQKEWLTNHDDIEFEQMEEDLILAFLDDTADTFINEYTE